MGNKEGCYWVEDRENRRGGRRAGQVRKERSSSDRKEEKIKMRFEIPWYYHKEGEEDSIRETDKIKRERAASSEQEALLKKGSLQRTYSRRTENASQRYSEQGGGVRKDADEREDNRAWAVIIIEGK